MKNTLSIILAAGLVLSCSAGVEPTGEYRNIAAYHATYHSSAFNYDLTAQLATDGIISDADPAYYEVFVNGENIIKQDQHWLFDYRSFVKVSKIECNAIDLKVDFVNIPFTADRVVINGQLHWLPSSNSENGYDVKLQYTTDGQEWIDAYSCKSEAFPLNNGYTGEFAIEAELPEGTVVKGFRFISAESNVEYWQFSALDFYNGSEEVDIYNLVPETDAWMSWGREAEWLYVDLGEERCFNKLVCHWINAPMSGSVLVSKDAKHWKEIATFETSADEPVSEIAAEGSARYVKLAMGPAENGERLALSEMEVWGWSDESKPASAWSLVREDLEDDPSAWVPTEVPSTVLAAYIDAGIVPNPDWGDNNQQISDSYFKHNFIYRGVLTAPENESDRVFLNFDGINWKADVYMNDIELGHIDGAFIHTRFDVTDVVVPGDNNIEVLIYCNDNPSSGKGNTIIRDAYNGGILGADNPTFHASIGWDWIPNVHGRNIGIWNDVYFSTSGEVTVEEPFVRSVLNLPDTTAADVTVSAVLENHGVRTVDVEWKGSLGEFGFSRNVRLRSGERREVSASLHIDNPRLWWPNGYGEQNLYDVHMDAIVDGDVSHSRNFATGIRQNTYSTETGYLTVWVNGKRFSGRGGNWGFSEYNLRYREKEYDIAVGLHAEENFTMIRNWVGQTMDDEFWEACDRHGIMVWQDFWLANPLDGPDPYDEDMFMANAEDLLKRLRNHPCMVLYVGRNEGCPPPSLDGKLRAAIAKYHPEIYYTPDSSHGVVGGNGHYNRFSAYEFFRQWEDDPVRWGQDRVHSEKGMPNVPNYESVVKFIPEDYLWPQNDMWGVHDWSMTSAQKVSTFNDALWKMFGEPKDARQFCEWAQWVNYDGYRAIFESRSAQRRGLTLWMSHAAWPTFVWCTYDYYFDPTGAFYGCKKANEPIHMMYNALTGNAELMNYGAGNHSALTARTEILDMWGKVLDTKEVVVDSPEDSTVELYALEGADEDVYYYRMSLIENGTLISDNFYVQGREVDNFQALHKLPRAKLAVSESRSLADGQWTISYTISNSGKAPAMMLRLLALQGKGGERILPVHYSDNFFHLMPGESKTVTVRALASDCDGKEPYIALSGFNYR